MSYFLWFMVGAWCAVSLMMLVLEEPDYEFRLSTTEHDHMFTIKKGKWDKTYSLENLEQRGIRVAVVRQSRARKFKLKFREWLMK